MTYKDKASYASSPPCRLSPYALHKSSISVKRGLWMSKETYVHAQLICAGDKLSPYALHKSSIRVKRGLWMSKEPSEWERNLWIQKESHQTHISYPHSPAHARSGQAVTVWMSKETYYVCQKSPMSHENTHFVPTQLRRARGRLSPILAAQIWCTHTQKRKEKKTVTDARSAYVTHAHAQRQRRGRRRRRRRRRRQIQK